MQQIWKIIIRPDQDAPDLAQGWALADCEADAWKLAGSPYALAFPSLEPWTGPAGADLVWHNYAWPRIATHPIAQV